jgi:hypothetical protein
MAKEALQQVYRLLPCPRLLRQVPEQAATVAATMEALVEVIEATLPHEVPTSHFEAATPAQARPTHAHNASIPRSNI